MTDTTPSAPAPRYVQHPDFPGVVREVTGGPEALKQWTEAGWKTVKKDDEAAVLAAADQPKA